MPTDRMTVPTIASVCLLVLDQASGSGKPVASDGFQTVHLLRATYEGEAAS